MKLVAELTEGSARFESALILTYNLDLAWFEALIHRQLSRRGLRRALILADEEQLSHTLAEQASLLRGVGRSYLVQGVRMSGAFHPKAILLTSEKAARLYVGSGNLTASGYGRNIEVFASWQVDEKATAVPAAFGEFRRYMEGSILPRLEASQPAIKEHLDAAFGVRCLTRGEEEARTTLWGSPGGLLPRLEGRLVEEGRLTLLAPFFDDEGALVCELAEKLNAPAFDVITDLSAGNLTRAALTRIEAAGGSVLVLDEDRRLHAKVLFAELDDGPLALIGSANYSNAAWHGHNAELVVASREDEARVVEALVDELVFEAIDTDERGTLPDPHQKDEEGGHEDETAVAPQLLAALWGPGAGLTAHLAAPPADELDFVLRQGTSERPCTLKSHAGLQCILGIDGDASRGEVAMLGVRRPGGVVRWTPVTDLAAIVERSRPTGALGAHLKDLLGDSTFDEDGLARLVRLVADVARNRAATRVVSTGQDGAPSSGETDSPEDDWTDIDDADFSSGTGAAGVPREFRHVVGLSPGLIRSLLFGSDTELEADDTEGESEEAATEAALERESAGPGEKTNGKKRKGHRLTERLEAAFDGYLKEVAAGAARERTTARLLDDLAVLAGILHYSLRGGALDVRGFRNALVRLLQAFIGSASHPLPVSLRRLDQDAVHDLCHREGKLLLVALLLYNSCLADADARGFEGDLHRAFRDNHPSLWMRNVLRCVEETEARELLEALPRQAPALRRGILWLAPVVPRTARGYPVDCFLEDLVDDTLALLAFESWWEGQQLRAQPEDGDAVLVAGRDGKLAAGWFEEAGTRGEVRAHDGAFQDAQDKPLPPRTKVMLARGVRAVGIEAIEEALPEDPQVKAGWGVFLQIGES